MKSELEQIGSRIEKAMKDAGLDRTDLSHTIGVGIGAVGKYIRGESDSGVVAFMKISVVCKVSVDWLITGKEPEINPYPTTAIGNETIAESTFQGSQYAKKINLMVADMDEDMQKDICLSVEKEKLLRDLLRQKDSDKKAS